jgi:dihydroneopterin triphosphate diphosphatase
MGESAEFCVLRRSDDEVWQWVAGGGEESEEPPEAARREVREELGLYEVGELYALDSQGSVPAEVFAAQSTWPSGLRTIPEYSFALECPGEVVLSSEHIELRWCGFDEAQRMLRYESNRAALRELAERLQHNRLAAMRRPPEGPATNGVHELVPPINWEANVLIDAPRVLLRHVTNGRIALAMGVREIRNRRGGVMLHVADGTTFRSARAPDGSKQRSLTEWILADVSWSGGEALHVVQLGDWFSVICLWRNRRFVGWHVNFQRPLRPSSLGWETEDLVLDIEVAPDHSWSVRDLADFENAVDEGHLEAETSAAVLRAMDEAIMRLDGGYAPFSEDWTAPPPIVASPVSLPDGWESLQS